MVLFVSRFRERIITFVHGFTAVAFCKGVGVKIPTGHLTVFPAIFLNCSLYYRTLQISAPPSQHNLFLFRIIYGKGEKSLNGTCINCFFGGSEIYENKGGNILNYCDYRVFYDIRKHCSADLWHSYNGPGRLWRQRYDENMGRRLERP